MSVIDSEPHISSQAYSEALRSEATDHTQGGTYGYP